MSLNASLYTPFFFENFTNVWSVTKSDDGKIVADWPILWSDGPIVAFSAADTGKCMRVIRRDVSTLSTSYYQVLLS